MRVRHWLGTLALLAVQSTAHAQGDARAQAKEYFKAGATAYAAGDYLAAIQALEAAHDLTPHPAIAFSLAQAERRQFFVSRDQKHLQRAIELFRAYLVAVPSGGRRVDAADALTQLEPLVTSRPSEAPSSPAPTVAASANRTRLMVSSEAPNAAISLDGKAPVSSPLIAEVSPGMHLLRVTADGFFPSERRVVAVQGELVPIEVSLRERPSIVRISAPASADLYVDGTFVGQVHDARRLELASGAHVFNFAMNGRRVTTVEVELGRGEMREISATLRPTSQRIAARALLVTSGAALAGGMLLGAFAIANENDAEQILGKKSGANIGPRERESYEDALEERGRFRAGAIASFSLSAGALLAAILMHELDSPSLKEAFRPPERDKAQRRAPARATFTSGVAPLGVDVRVAF